jgi:hypothetical protein
MPGPGLAGLPVAVVAQGQNPLNELSTMNESMEYMAFKLPTAAFALYETRISTGGDAAVYVKPNDVRDYAEAIVPLLDDEDNRAGWARWGVSMSSRNSPGVIRNIAYLGVYQRLTGGPQGPRPDRGGLGVRHRRLLPAGRWSQAR